MQKKKTGVYITIGDNKYLFRYQWFESSNSYYNYFKNKNLTGLFFSLYKDNKLILSIELGNCLVVNQQLKFLISDQTELLSDEILLDITAAFSYMFSYKYVLILSNYENFSVFKKNYPEEVVPYLYCFTFNYDIYNFFKYNIKRFYDFKEITPLLPWYKLENQGKEKISPGKNEIIKIIEKEFTCYNKLIQDIKNNLDSKYVPLEYKFDYISYLEKKEIVKSINIFPKYNNEFSNKEIDNIFRDNPRS